MKNSLLTLAFAASAVAPFCAYAEEAPITLYGVKLYCQEGCSSGLYSVEATPGAYPKLEWSDGDMMGNGGMVYDGEKMYVLNYLDFYGTLYWTYLICDVESHTYDWDMPQLAVKDVGSAMTYDPSTGNSYSICIDPVDNTKFTLSTLNYADGSKTIVGPIERMGALAADANGTLYGIGMDGCLYIVDKFTAAITLVGDTGVRICNNQSAVIDYATGDMYWNAITADEDVSYLYKVNTKTAEVSLISEYSPKFQFAGLFIKQTAVTDGAPASVEEMTAIFEKASLRGAIEFRIPSNDVDGNPLKGELHYAVKLGNDTLASGMAMPGEEIEAKVSVDHPALYQFYVTVENSSGVSVPVSRQLWVGADRPHPVENLVAVKGADNKVGLKWEMAPRGINGGYVDPESLRFVLIRGPYGELIDSSYDKLEYEEEFDQEGVHPLMYGVHAYVDEDYVTDMVMSNVLIMGDYWEAPFSENLADPFRSLVFKAHDGNEDDCTWVYDYDFEGMKCMWALDETSDDWLFSPAVKLSADKYYSVSALVRSEGKWNADTQEMEDVYCGNLGIYLCAAQDSESVLSELMIPTEVTGMEEHEKKTQNFEVSEDGVYHIGLHHSGPRSIYYMILSRLNVNEEKDSRVMEVLDVASPIFAVKNGTLHVWNGAGEAVSIYSLDGKMIYNGKDAHTAISLPAGIYVCNAAGKTSKIFVR